MSRKEPRLVCVLVELANGEWVVPVLNRPEAEARAYAERIAADRGVEVFEDADGDFTGDFTVAWEG